MAARTKKKPKQERSVPVGEMVKLAEERLQRGQPDEAIGLLLRADGEVQRGASSGAGKHAALPPHLAAVQPAIAPLLARALFQRALTTEDPARKIADLKEAVKRAPDETRYRLALGACRLAQGN